jgi:hypothetical protein
MARKPTIADVLGFGTAKRDYLAPSALRRAVERPTVATGGLKPAYRPISQRIAEAITPNTKGGVKAARQIQGILDFVTALGSEEDLVQSQGAFQRGDYGNAAKFGILAALGAIPGGKGAGTAARSTVRDFSNIAFDPALYGLRKTKDLPRLQASPATYQRTSASPQAQSVSIADYIGRPYIISMADRTAAGDLLTRIGNVDLNFPVSLQGGQDFMFNPTTGGLVWASEKSPVSNIMNLAGKLYEKTGQKPIYLPYRMAGSGSDFATMTGETMMAYADAVLDAADKARFNKIIAEKIPGFKGISDPRGYQQFAQLTGAKRKALQNKLSTEFGEAGGGLTLPMVRGLIADPNQIDKPSFFLQNVGEIDPTRDVLTGTGHRTYSRGVPGQGLGILSEDINVAHLTPNLSKIYQIGDPNLFRGQEADFTEYGRQLKIAEAEKARQKALAKGKEPKNYNTERGGTTKYMMSGAKFGILTEDMVRSILGQ